MSEFSKMDAILDTVENFLYTSPNLECANIGFGMRITAERSIIRTQRIDIDGERFVVTCTKLGAS